MNDQISMRQEALEAQNLDALLVSNNANIAYLTGITHFSVEEREAFVLVVKKHLYLFTDARYTGGITKQANITIIECSANSTFYQHFSKLVQRLSLESIGFEPANLTVFELEHLKSIFKEKEIKSKLIPVSGIIEKQKAIKSSVEIENIRQACTLSDQAFTHILPLVKKGITEKEIAAELEYFMIKHGGEPAFETIVAFGANAAVPHHATSNDKLTKMGTPILLDFGAQVNGYCSDITRTIFWGKTTPALEQQYKATHFIQTKALDALQKAMRTHHKADAKEVAEAADEALHKTGFPAIPHALGHGVGLQVHESPVLSVHSKDILKPGMTITIEPGIYLQDKAGIRIEDTLLLTDEGVEILTQAPKSIIIL